MHQPAPEQMTDVADYLARKFAPADVRDVANGVVTHLGQTIGDDDLVAIAATARHEEGVPARVADEDLVLRTRLCAYCLELGHDMGRALALLSDSPDALGMDEYRRLVASVAVVAAPGVAEAVRRMTVVSEATMAIAVVAGVPEATQRPRRMPGALSS